VIPPASRSFRLRGAFLVAAFLFVVPELTHASPPGAGWTLAWDDEFSGTALDTTKWGYFTGNNQGGFDDSGPPTIAVSGGHLVITTWTNTTGVQHTGWINTENGFQNCYGYWEASIRFNESSGEWSAFWLQPSTINNVSSPADPADNGTEIDIVEHRLNHANQADENLHWNGYGSSEVNGGPGTVNNPGSTSLQGNWHTYGLMWNTGTYTFYIDGTVVGTSTTGISMQDQFIYLSTFVNGASWAGTIPSGGYGLESASTTHMDVDYVRFYSRGERVINSDFSGRVAPFSAIGAATWGAAYGQTGAGGGRLAPTSASICDLEQTVYGLRPNTDYVSTGWGQVVTGATAQILVGAKSYGGSQVTAQLSGTLPITSWNEGAVPFTTGPTNTTANLFMGMTGAGNVAHVDNINLYRGTNVSFGSFENGNFAVWTNYGSTSVSTANSYGGSYSVQYGADTSSAGVQQDIFGLQPNTLYRLSGWTTNGNQGITFGAKNFGGTETFNTISASTWTRGTVDFVTGTNNTSATIYAYRPTSSSVSYVDDFFLYQPLTGPWSSQNVGAFTLQGTAGTRGNEYVLQASGADIWTTTDHFHFINQPVAGDCQITARLRAIDDTNAAAKVGIMMRDSLASTAREMNVNWQPQGDLELGYRLTDGAATAGDENTSLSAPPWARLVRRGNVITGYYSADGVNWTQIDQQNLSLDPTIYIGIEACSHDETQFAEGVVDNVSVVPLGPNMTIVNPAGGNITVTGTAANLHMVATMQDDGLHGTPTYQGWSQVSGPATVTFSNAGSMDTTVNFPQPGVYVLQVAGSNSNGPSTSQVTVVLTRPNDPTLALRLRLDESGGTTAFDSSGNGNNGTVSGGATWSPTGGVLAGDLTFDGVSGEVIVPNALDLGQTSAFTLSYWFNVANINNSQGLVAKRDQIDTNNDYTTFLQTDGHIYVDINSSNDRFSSNTVFAPGTWYHVALVYDGTQPAAQRASLYVNGVLDTVATESSASIPDSTSTFKLASTSGTSGFMAGSLDDVRFYQRALSSAEVVALANLEIAPTVSTPPSLTATSGVAIALSGAIGVDAGGSSPSAAWTQRSGPQVVSFANPANPATSATLSGVGSYTLRLSASNTAAEVFTDMPVTVVADSSSFQDWMGSYFPGSVDPNVIGDQANPAHDGVSNLTKYALGLDPTAGDDAVWKPGHAGLPVEAWCNVAGTNYLSIQVRRPIGLAGITYGAEVTSNMSLWTAGVQQGAPVANGDGTETVTFRDTVPVGAGKRFIRLKITGP
jgi:hypothetical protein